MRQDPPNARFWTWWNGDWVQLTLRPGQTVTLHNYHTHEEGWAEEVESFEYDESLGMIYCTIESNGRDCDGRLDRRACCKCPVERLHAGPPTDDGKPPGGRPDWSEAPGSCVYDEEAQKAGY